jgi:hypothetical protein
MGSISMPQSGDRDHPHACAQAGTTTHCLGYCWSMIFSENRCPLFGIML